MLEKLVGNIIKAKLNGKEFKKITIDSQTFAALKQEWKEQDMYKGFSSKFLFGLEVVVVDGMTLE